MTSRSFTLLLLVVAAFSTKSYSTPNERYEVIGRIPGPPTGSWDYAIEYPASRRIYLASDGILVLDATTNKVSRLNVTGTNTHGLAPLKGGLMAVADGHVNQVKIVVAETGVVLWSIPTGASPSKEGWHNPDALLVDPATGLLIAVNGDSGTLQLIDTKARGIVGTVYVGGKLEFAASVGQGRIAVNIESANAVAVVDIKKKQVVSKVALRDCDSPTGLAYDAADDLAISVCDNGKAIFNDLSSGVEAASVQVGKGADAILFDSARKVAFATAGDDGSISVINVPNRENIAVIQSIKTAPGVRLGALDPISGNLYLPVVEYRDTAGSAVSPSTPERPVAIPATFAFLVVGPTQRSVDWLKSR